MNRMLTPNDIAAYLQVDETDVIHWINRGELGATRLEGKWRICPENLEYFMSQRENETQLEISRNNLFDKSRWTDLLIGAPHVALTIQDNEYQENSFGEFLQNAVEERNASQKASNIVSLKSLKKR